MAKVTLVQWKYQQMKDSTYPIYIRVYKNGKTKIISTGHSVRESDWDDQTKQVKRTDKNFKRLNNLFGKMLQDAQ